MGTKTYVGSSNTYLVENKPDIVKESVLSSIFGKKDLVPTLMADLLHGYASKVNRYYNYGRDHFIFGLPEGYVSQTEPDIDALQIVLDGVAGEPVFIEQAVIGLMDAESAAYEYMQDNLGWDYQTGLVSGVGPSRYYYSSFIVGEGELSISTIATDDGIPAGTEEAVVYSVPGLTQNNFYYKTIYSLISDPLARTWWNYDTTLGTYPELIANPEVAYDSPFYPIVPLRIDKEYVNENKTTELYLTSQKILSKVGLDIDYLIDEIENSGNGEDNMKNVYDAFVVYATNLQTEDPASMSYLARFFSNLRFKSTYTKQDWIDWENSSKVQVPPGNQVNIFDEAFRCSINYHYVTSELKSGDIGDPQPEPDTTTVPIDAGEYPNLNAVYKQNATGTRPGTVTRQNYIKSEGEVIVSQHVTYNYERSLLVFRTQLPDLQFIETVVHGPVHISNVYKRRTVTRNLEESIATEEPDDEDHAGQFYVPLNRTIVRTFSARDESYIYYDALQIVFYSVKKVHTKWYESASFLKLVQIVIIVVSVYFQVGEIGAALAEGLTIQAIATLVLNVAITYAVTFAFEEIANYIGGDLALLFAAVAAGVAAYNGAFSAQGAGGKMPWADALMQSSTLMTQAVQNNTEDDWDALKKEANEFLKTVEEAEEEIARAEEYLGEPTDDINYFALTVDTYLDFNESPDMMYSRMIHQTNPGVLSLSTPATFIANALRLPEANSIEGLTL